MKRKVRAALFSLGIMTLAVSITACRAGNATSSASAAESQTDIDAIVEKKVQEQLEIERRVKESVDAAMKKETAASTITMAAAPASTNGGTYILPFSNTRLVTDADLAPLSKDQLRLARNEIFARHGRIFKSDDLNNYFKAQSWYTPSIPADQFNESILSKVESDNVARISEYEKSGSVGSAMKLKDGKYVLHEGHGTETINVEFHPHGDWPIYFEEYCINENGVLSSDCFGYITDNGNGTYTATVSTGTDEQSANNEYTLMSFRMTQNGFKDIQTGNLYEYSK